MKTNAARLLDSLGIPYRLLDYEVDPDDLTAESVAAKIGMPAEQVLERLRRVREIQMRGEAVAHATAQIPQAGIETVPLEQCLDDFWRAGGRSGEWEQFSFSSSPHHVQHALLRRLGPPPMNGKFPLVGLLASVYDAVSAAANRAADSAE